MNMNMKKRLEEVKKSLASTGVTNDELGRFLANYLEWDGEAIFRVARAAFEDANFHPFNESFKDEWEKHKNDDLLKIITMNNEHLKKRIADLCERLGFNDCEYCGELHNLNEMISKNEWCCEKAWEWLAPPE